MNLTENTSYASDLDNSMTRYEKSAPFSRLEQGLVCLAALLLIMGTIGIIFHQFQFGGKWDAFSDWMKATIAVKGQEVAVAWIGAIFCTTVGGSGVLLAVFDYGKRWFHDRRGAAAPFDVGSSSEYDDMEWNGKGSAVEDIF